jgi:hypothetical protein
MMSEKEHKLSRPEALELVGDIVKRMVDISKEHDIPLSDPEKFKSDLRVSLFKNLEMFVELKEHPSTQAEEESNPILSEEGEGLSEQVKSKFGFVEPDEPSMKIFEKAQIEQQELPIKFKTIEGEGGYADFYEF